MNCREKEKLLHFTSAGGLLFLWLLTGGKYRKMERWPVRDGNYKSSTFFCFTTMFTKMIVSSLHRRIQCVLLRCELRLFSPRRGGRACMLLWWENNGEVWKGRSSVIQKGRSFSLQPADLKPGRVHCNKCIISARRPFWSPLSCALLLLTPPLGSPTRPYARPLSYNAAF